MSNEAGVLMGFRGGQAVVLKRLKVALKGYKYLKRKNDALRVRFRLILSKILEAKTEMGNVMKEAYMSLAEAKFTTGNFSNLVLQNVTTAHIRVMEKFNIISGIKVTTFETFEASSDSYELTGLSRGGQQLSKLKKTFGITIDFLMKIASLQNSFILLNDAIKSTSTKVNALEHIVIPRLKHMLVIITNNLEEEAREHFHRMKMIQRKKQAKMQKI